MHKSRSVIVGLLIITLFLNTSGYMAASGSSDGSAPLSHTMASPEIQVMLSAAHRTTSWDDRVPERPRFDLPLLYLRREREGAAKVDRTLTISISGLVGGTEIEVEVVSLHADVSASEEWEETRRFVLPERPCTSDDPCALQWTFDPTTTLSDLYYLRVKDSVGQLLWENPHPDRPDFVMLDTWDVGLDGYIVRVYYATLFPFARGENDIENRLPPDAVTDFIEHRFVPMIVDTWNTQFHTWGFTPVHPDWDPDRIIEVIIADPPFALFDGTGTYTRLIGADGRPYPERRIWWFSSHNGFQAYDSLENGYKVVFSHEFFHLVQWNTLLSTGRPESFWLHVFIEAQAKLAPSVQYPELEIRRDHVVVGDSAYASAANRFLALRLNTSYAALEAGGEAKYDATLYWRFLYEQFNDTAIIRAALEEMAYHFAPDIVGSIEVAMNEAFARVDGPFRTFEESLVAFARANYALRLKNGRCIAEDPAECDRAYYDPDNTYVGPSLEAELNYDGSLLTYDGSIATSFGMDFVEVSLNPVVHDRPLVVTFQGEGAVFQGEGSVAQFSVQIWKLRRGARPHAVTPHPEIIPQDHGEARVYVIPYLDTTTYDRLALIITRLDPDETSDPAANYSITLDSTTR
jgi:hypothetical protein